MGAVVLYAGVALLSVSAGLPQDPQDCEESASEIFKERMEFSRPEAPTDETPSTGGGG